MAQTVRGAVSFTIPKREEEKKKVYADENALNQRKLDADAQAKAANDAYWADQYSKSQAAIKNNTTALKNGATNAAAGAAMINRPTLDPKDPNGDPDSLGSYGRAYASFVPSQTYYKAMEYTQSLLDQLSSGRTSFTDKVNSALKAIEDKEPFSYDPNSDMLFQNYLQGMMQSGQVAMQDTMGQAAALTGGYGSTYATTAGNQAYNSMVQGAYEELPEFAQYARDAYDRDVKDLYDRLDMYSTQDALEYDRLANAYGLNAEAAARLYDQEYNNFWQTQDFNEDSRRWAAEMGYKERQAKQAQDNWDAEFKLKQDANSGAAEAYKEVDSNLRKDMIKMASDYGDSQELWDYGDSLAAMGYDPDMVYQILKANIPKSEYSVKDESGYYTDQWGNHLSMGLDGAPAAIKKADSFVLVKGKKNQDDSEYQDEFGNKYTYQQLKAWGLTKKIK